jgi:hypothetical protein
MSSVMNCSIRIRRVLPAQTPFGEMRTLTAPANIERFPPGVRR